MSIVLYSTHCPKCEVLEKKLKNKNISFEINTDIDEMTQKGFTSVPVLEIDGESKDFSAAISWVNNLG